MAAAASLGATVRQYGIDYREIRVLSRGADFFHGYPRLGPSTIDGVASNVFAVTAAYRRSLVYLGLPYLATAFVLVAIAITFNLYRYCRRGISPGADDTKDSNPSYRDCTAKAYLFFSAFLYISIFLLIGAAFGANNTMRHAAQSSKHALHTLSADLSREVIAPSIILTGLLDTIRHKLRSNPSLLQVHQSTLVPAVQLINDNAGAFRAVRKGLVTIRSELANIDSYIQWVSLTVHGAITATLLCFIVGNFLVYFCDVSPPRAHRTRVAMIILFALPLAASWALVALCTSIGAATGDFCYSLRDYHRLISYQSGSAGPPSTPINGANIFIKFDLGCPAHSTIGTQLGQVNQFFIKAANQSTFWHAMELLDGRHNHSEWAKGMRWSEDRFKDFSKCQEQLRFGGLLSYHMCDTHNSSAAAAITLMWLSAVGLSLLFGVLLFMSSLGQPPAEFATGQEMLYLYGAPKLISMFGDSKGALSRHSTFHRIASQRMSQGSADGPIGPGIWFKNNSAAHRPAITDSTEATAPVQTFPTYPMQSYAKDVDDYREVSESDPSTESSSSTR